ncbi:MAG: ABC transporter permease [Thermoguttaceae bacterium]
MTGYLRNIWQLRYFWMALVRNDLRNRYRRSVIGIGWSLLHPIAMTIVLCMVFTQLYHQNLREYAPYVLSGLTYWGFISAVVMQGCQCFFQGEHYIRQQPAPLAIYPLRTTLGAGFHFVLGLGVAIVLVWCFKGFGNLPTLMYLVPTLALLFVVGWSLAACTGLSNVLFQDSQHLFEVLMQILFYLTPIFWHVDSMPSRFRQMAMLNPFAVLLDLVRKPLLEGQCPSWSSVLFGAAIGAVAVGAASLALKRFEKRIIFYL